MLRKGLLIVTLLTVCSGVSAQTPQPPEGDFQWWHSCEELKKACADETDLELIWWAASIDEHPGPAHPYGDGPILGTCYTHDRRSCPGCACSDYVKLSYKPNPKGYDGGTGCVTDRAAAAAELKKLCEEGKCCCPVVEPNTACPNQADVKARDPITGSCCVFPDICSKPSDWEAVVPWDARCDPNS